MAPFVMSAVASDTMRALRLRSVIYSAFKHALGQNSVSPDSGSTAVQTETEPNTQHSPPIFFHLPSAF